MNNLNSDFCETELGALPAEWNVAMIGDVLEPRGESMQPSSIGKTRYVGLEHIGSGNSHLTRWGIESEVKSTKNKFYRDDLLYGKLRPYLDKAVLAEWDGVCATDILVFAANQERANPEFMVSLLHTTRFLEHAISTTTGVNHPRTSWHSIRTFRFGLPPLPEQRAIAHVLSTIQRAIETQDNLIAAARELKKSLMRQLFTQGLDANGAVKETEIGLMPEHWELVKLENVFESRLGKMLSGASRKGISPRLYVRNANVQWGKVDLTDIAQMDFHEDERKEFRLKKGDILVCEGGEIGRTAIWHDEIAECYFQKAIHRLRPVNENYDREFFLYHMMHAFLLAESYGMVGTKTTIAHLPGVKLKALKIPMPPLSEQREIARILATADKKIENEEKRKAALEALFKTMLQNLMTGKIRVT